MEKKAHATSAPEKKKDAPTCKMNAQIRRHVVVYKCQNIRKSLLTRKILKM
jgi:hypothetical protein